MGISSKRVQKTAEASIMQLSFEEWETPVVMFSQNKQPGMLWVCTFKFFLLVQIKLKHVGVWRWGKAQTHTAMHEHTGGENKLRFRAALYT